MSTVHPEFRTVESTPRGQSETVSMNRPLQLPSRNSENRSNWEHFQFQNNLITQLSRSRGSSVGIALSYGLDDRGFEFRWGLGIFFTTASRTILEPTQPPIQWAPGAFSLGVKRQGREAYHSPPSSAEVKNAWSYTSTPPTGLNGVVLS
jgi:hypothetical protein